MAALGPMGGNYQLHAFCSDQQQTILDALDAQMAARALHRVVQPRFAADSNECQLKILARQGFVVVVDGKGDFDPTSFLRVSAVAPLITMWMHDGDVWGYVVAENGRVAAEFATPSKAFEPTRYFGGEVDASLFVGNPAAVARALGQPNREKQIAKAHKKGMWPFAGSGIDDFARSIGLPNDAFELRHFATLRYARASSDEHVGLEPPKDDALPMPTGTMDGIETHAAAHRLRYLKPRELVSRSVTEAGQVFELVSSAVAERIARRTSLFDQLEDPAQGHGAYLALMTQAVRPVERPRGEPVDETSIECTALNQRQYDERLRQLGHVRNTWFADGDLRVQRRDYDQVIAGGTLHHACYFVMGVDAIYELATILNAPSDEARIFALIRSFRFER